MNQNLISSIFRSPWMMDASFAQSYMPMVVGMLSGKPVALETVKSNTYIISGSNTLRFRDSAAAQENSVAILEIKGAITKYDQECGPKGMHTKNRQLTQLANMDNIGAILLDIDSGGGEATHLETIYNTISKIDKPVIAHYSGYCCSAAYYIACAADKIYANEAHDTVGSIGTLCSFYDMREYLKKEGITEHVVFADQSTNKQGIFRKALEGDYAQLKKEILNPLAQNFIDAVKAKRSIRNSEVFTGSTYNTSQAIGNGLIDGQKSFGEALAYTKSLISKK